MQTKTLETEKSGLGEDGEFYLFAAPSGVPEWQDAEYVFYQVRGARVAEELCRLFARQFGSGRRRLMFKRAQVDDLDVVEQVLMDEALDSLRVFDDPDPGVHDPEPDRETMERAQFGVRAKGWEAALREKLKASKGMSGPSGNVGAGAIGSGVVFVAATATGSPPAARGNAEQFSRLGRLEYTPDFQRVRLEGQIYDLGKHPKARCCLKLLVDRKAFDEKSALHFDEVIHPHVKGECGSNATEPKIHDYFAAKGIARLREILVRSAGRNGKFYLAVN